jgi:hypothetical protein
MAEETRLDGNAAGGLLAEVFRFETTMARVTCANCGRVAETGAETAYGLEMGLVLRCAGCEGVLLRVTHLGGAYRLDMRGVALLEVSTSD